MTLPRSFAVCWLAILFGVGVFGVGAAHAGRSRLLPLSCIYTGYGLYGEVAQGPIVLHSWGGPCIEGSVGFGWWVEHEILEKTIRSKLSAGAAGFEMTATAQARFAVNLGRRYYPTVVVRRLRGAVRENPQGLMVEVRCPNVSPAVWWYPWPATPSFVAPVTGTCELRVRDVCSSDGAGACVAEVGVR